jgi:CRP/FNR family transcriptional regulator
MIAADVLAALPLFDEAPDCVVGSLASRAVEVRYAPNTVVFFNGVTPRGWVIVLEGEVRVVRGRGARQHVVHTETRGGTLGEVPLYTGRTHPATAIASEPTRCAVFDRASLEAAIRECPAIAFLLAGRLALRVEALVKRLDERSAASVRSRLIEFLLSRAESSRTASFSVGMTQQALAEELGTVREVVSRELRRLCDEQLLIAMRGGRYVIPNREALRRADDTGTDRASAPTASRPSG